MSAFVVNPNHVNAIIRALWDEQHPLSWRKSHTQGYARLTHETADEVGRMLLAENIRSVQCRYPDLDLTGLSAEAAEFTVDWLWKSPTPVEALKLVKCLDYQSCETSNWESTEAFRFLEAARERLIVKLPGYEDAPWEWPENR